MVNDWSTFGDLTKEEAPQISGCGASSCLKRGSEGPSRTDTGSPPPVFELDAMPTHNLAWVSIIPRIEARTYP